MISRVILKIHGDYDKRLGSYKITHILNRDHGIKVSVGRVYRLIQKLNLPTMSTSKPFIKASKENCDDTKLCNRLKQEFNPPEPNIIWASDFTYIKVNGAWFYLFIIMDLFSRKIISWNISNKADCNLIISTFNDAYNKRNRPTGLMFHSDRGTQYTATPFRKLLDKFNVVQSFSKKGYPFDNACCESFFKYLKKEECNRKNYHSIGELKLSLFEYIEGFYNLKRPHYSLGLMTPNEKELAFYKH